MPELPEVETVVRDLRPLIVGKTIHSAQPSLKQLRKPWLPEWNTKVIGCRIEAVKRRGKWIILDLAAGTGFPTGPTEDGLRLLVHLGMTGQFTMASAAASAPDHLHLVFGLTDGWELRFRDTRRFGSVSLIPDAPALAAFFEGIGLGPEPFGLGVDYFRESVRRTSRTLKAILLDQRVLVGVGNIYADEACHRAQLHPGRPGKSLTRADVDRLRIAIESVLTRAIEQRGSTIRDYIGGSGLKGGFQTEFAVYGRTASPCLTCAAAIECIRLSGRASHFCPRCQRARAGKG